MERSSSAVRDEAKMERRTAGVTGTRLVAFGDGGRGLYGACDDADDVDEGIGTTYVSNPGALRAAAYLS